MPHSFRGTVFTNLRSTLERTHGQTDRLSRQKLHATLTLGQVVQGEKECL